MDPLSITAGILAILGAGGKVGNGLKKIIALKHAPDALLALNNEVTDVQIAVQDVDDLLRRYTDLSKTQIPIIVIRSLQQTKKTVLLVECFIAYDLTTIEAGRQRVDKSEWFQATSKVQDLKTKLQADKSSLLLSLGVLTS